MTASRLCRILVLVLATGVVVFAGRPARVPAAPRGGGRSVPVLFDSILVSPARFSPDGNRAQDSVAVYYTLPETADVFVHVTAAGSAGIIIVLQDSAGVLPGVQQQRWWDGFDPMGFRQPEGLYTIHFDATTVTQRVLSNQRQVRLDLTAPAPSVLDVVPRRIALPRDAGVTPNVRLRVSQSELDDRIGIAVIDASGAPRDTLRPEGGFAGDGDYVFLCRGLADPDSAYADGMYQLHIVGLDLAGNDSTVVDSLDKNTRGPAIAVSHPPAPRTVQRADSLVGQATDRQSVVAMEAKITGADTTTIALPPRDALPGQTYRFGLDVSTLLAAEGTYAIRLRATDEDGIPDSLLFHVRVDRTPPPAPIPIPPLPEVTSSQVLTVTVQVDTTDTSRIVFTGGVQPPDSLFAVNPLVKFTRTLAAGANRIGVKAVDRAGNISAEHVSTVVWDTGTGITAPERFFAGQSIEVNLAGRTAQSVSVRILAMDGGLVRTFHDGSAKQYYRFPWDLRTPDGREVRNGAYLVLAHVLYTDGTERRLRTMIAVVQ